jgi:DNA processing protein
MTRNSVIIGLSWALIVVEASDRGGTLAAGTKALQMNRRVFTMEFAQNPRGNADMVRHGAIPIPSRARLLELLAQLADTSGGNQLSMRARPSGST